MNVGIKKTRVPIGYPVRDRTVISFESISACDRRKDTPPIAISRSSIAKRDIKIQ